MNQAKQLIQAFPTHSKSPPRNDLYLNVSEFYYDTIQGEGVTTGCPAAFLRLQGCIMNCVYCDTMAIWRRGNPYSFDELFKMMELELIDKFKQGQHFVLTGGSPLRQQKRLVLFLGMFEQRYNFIPYTEIENECVFTPLPRLLRFIHCWNNSPKLGSSGQHVRLRYHPKQLRFLAQLDNSWFKFVISCKEEWDEIQTCFLDQGLIRRDQIILIPLGETREEIEKNRDIVIELAIRENVRYCTREHIIVWDKVVGV